MRLDDADLGGAEDGVEGVGEFRVSVADEEVKLLGAVVEVHEVPCLLGDPRLGRVGGDPGDVDVAGVVLDDD